MFLIFYAGERSSSLLPNLMLKTRGKSTTQLENQSFEAPHEILHVATETPLRFLTID